MVRRLLKNGALEVEAGFLKMKIPREDVVEMVSPNSIQSKLPRNVRLEAGPSFDITYRELNIIGQRAEEAIEHVDKFIDSAALASINRMRIVHGHGVGILNAPSANTLAPTPRQRLLPATPSEGGAPLSSNSGNRTSIVKPAEKIGFILGRNSPIAHC